MVRKAKRGAFLLLLANSFNRLLGFSYRIAIVRLVGAEGIGLYEMVFPVYTLALVLTTAGIPVALSKMTAEQTAHGQRQAARQTFRLALRWLIFSGAACTTLLFFLASRLSPVFFADQRAYLVFLATAPAVLVVTVSSAYRGYFQGQLWLGASAAGQVVEQVTRITLGLFLAVALLPHGVEYGALGLALAMLGGEVTGLVFLRLWHAYAERGTRVPERPLPSLPLWREMRRMAFPVTLTRAAGALLLSLEAMLVPRRLQIAGYSLQRSTELYGQFSGLAFTLISLPSILTVSLATALVPAIAEAMALRQHRLVRYRTLEALRITLLTGLPCAVIFYLFPTQLTSLFFANAEAALPLQILAPAAIFFYLQQTTSGILQGLGRMGSILRNSLLGTVVNLILLYTLTANPLYGIRGAALAAGAGSAVSALLNLVSVIRFTQLDMDLRLQLGRPLLSALFMALVAAGSKAYFMASGWPDNLALAAALLFGLVAYAGALALGGVLTREDLMRVPLLRRWA